MTRSTNSIRWATSATLGLAVLAGGVGCASTSTSHVIEPAPPAVSPHAMASAEPGFVAQPFSLVAADSIGLATFGDEIARGQSTPADADRVAGP